MSYVVKDYMEKDFPKVDVNATVLEASKLLVDGDKGYAIVLDKSQPKGIITDSDIIKKTIVEQKDPTKVKVAEIMSSPLVSVEPEEDLIKTAELLKKKGIKRVAVVKSGIIYGVVTTTTITQSCGEYVDKSVRDVLRWSVLPF